MIGQSNYGQILVGKDLNILGATSTADDLAVGQIGVFLVGSSTAKVDALASGDKFRIAFKNVDGVVEWTPVIEYDTVKNKKAQLYVAATERIRAIGFDGTSGSIDNQDLTTYTLDVTLFDNSKTYGTGKPHKFVSMDSSASATEAEIAEGLLDSFDKNFSVYKTVPVVAEMLLNNAGAAITGTGNLSVVEGSKFVSAVTDADAVVSVGDYLRIGTGVDDPVYLIADIDTVNDVIELSTPYVGDSATILEANAEYIAAATAASAAAGLVITGQPLDFSPGLLKYYKVDFGLTLSTGFGATTVSAIQAQSEGHGTYEKISEVESFLRGNKREVNRVASYPLAINLNATSGKTYDQITFAYKDLNAQMIDREVASFGNIYIATEDASVGAIHASLKTVLGIS